MRRSYRSWLLVLLVLICISILSCGPMIVTPERIEPDWLDMTTSITPGKTNRVSVRNLFGAPFLSSDYWNLDIFRQSAKQDALHGVFFFPVAYTWSTFYRYTLVTYDENNIVNDIQTGLTASSIWSNPAEDQYRYQGLELHSGHFTFIYDLRFGEFLFLESPKTANYLQILGPITECIAIVHTDMAYRNLAYLFTSDNGERKVVRPMRSRTLATLTLSSGRYTVEVSQQTVMVKNSKKSINCDKADVLYIDIRRVAYEHTFWMPKAIFRIDLYDEMPEAFVGLPQIIMSEGKWIVNPAQGRYSPDIFVHQ